MNTIKKIAKENWILLLVLAIVAVLWGYKQIHVTKYVTVNQAKVEKMLSNKKDFILIIGDDEYTDEEKAAEETDYTSNTSEQNLYVKKYISDYHQKVYYLAEDKASDINGLLEQLGSESTAYPQTFFIIDGQVYRSKNETVKYYDFSKLVADWKENK